MKGFYKFSQSRSKLVERLIDDDNVAINHMVLATGDTLPEHYTNSHVYLLITSGTLRLTLGEENAHQYEAGEIINIPYQTKMKITNSADDLLEFFVIKAPSPRSFSKKQERKEP